MLSYLVTSASRRRLLSLLWGDAAQGTVSELAERAGIAFSSAHTELKAMERAFLVSADSKGGKDLFSANTRHPQAKLLRALVDGERQPLHQPPSDEKLRRSLKALGAPLADVELLEVAPGDELQTLVAGIDAARRDPTLARTLPLCFWSTQASLNLEAVKGLKLRPEQKHALGFYLALTHQLAGAPRLLGLAEHLRDKRMTGLRDFFQGGFALRGRSQTFDLAAEWGFRMSMDFESFRSVFTKFTAA